MPSIQPNDDISITIDFDNISKSFYFVIEYQGEIIHSQNGFSHPSTARVTANMWLHLQQEKHR